MRLSQLSHLFARTPLAPDVEMADVARKTASFVARDLRLLHSHASATALSRVLRATQRVGQGLCFTSFSPAGPL